MDTETSPDAQPQPHQRSRRRLWALTGVLTGVLGLLATLRPFSGNPYPQDGSTIDTSILERVDTNGLRIALVLGYLAVAGLLVLAGQWRRHIESELPNSTASRVVSHGLVTSAAALSLAYGWMGALGLYGSGGQEENEFDPAGLYTYFVLTDFSPFIGWLGVVVAAGAIAWMGIVERSLPLWIGILSVLPVLATMLFIVAVSLPGAPGLVGSIWLTIAFIGLTLSRPRMPRTRGPH